MADPVEPTPESLLRLIAASAPEPWRPKVYARTAAAKRDALDAPLNDLRMAGLVKLTDWEKEIGQGYLPTPFGKEVLDSPALLAQLGKGLKPEAAKKVDVEAPASGPMTTFERGELVRNALLMPERPSVAPVLIILNVLAFAATFFLALRNQVDAGTLLSRGDASVVHDAGGLMALDLVRGEWWRLLTCCFLHFGVFHLGINMYSLYVQGRLLEPVWGPQRFLIIYLVSGLGGSCGAMLYDPGTPEAQVVLAGASGAIWGLMTSTIAWIGLNREHIPGPALRLWVQNWWVVLLLNVAISFAPNVSAPAHFAGGAVGVLLGTVLHYHRISGPGPLRSLMTALVALAPVVLVGAVHSAMESDPRWQRIVQAEQTQERAAALASFRKGPAALVNEVAAQLDSVEARVSPLLIRPKEQRDAEGLATAKQGLGTVAARCQEALDKLGDKQLAVDAAEKLRRAGREFMADARDYAKTLEKALDSSDPMQTERDRLKKAVDARRTRWVELLKRD